MGALQPECPSPAQLGARTSRSASSRSSSSARSSGAANSRRSRVSRWTHWQTEWDDQIPEEDVPDDEPDGADLDEEEELVRDGGDQSEGSPRSGSGPHSDGLAQSRGYYQVDANKGKGKGKSKGIGKQRPKGGAGKGKGASKGTRKGKSKKGTGKSIGLVNKQARLRGSLCLGCGSADHWIKDCPHVSSFQAQLASI